MIHWKIIVLVLNHYGENTRKMNYLFVTLIYYMLDDKYELYMILWMNYKNKLYVI